MLVLAYVDDMSETHHNLEVILSHLQIDKCSYIFTGDLKVLNLVLGISVIQHDLHYFCLFLVIMYNCNIFRPFYM